MRMLFVNLLLLFTLLTNSLASPEAVATSSVSVSGTSQEDIDLQLQSAAKQALEALAANPDDIDNVLQQLANVLLTEIGDIIVTMLEGGTIEPEVVSADISDAVGNALSVAAASGNAFQGLEVDIITQEIRMKIENILLEANGIENLDVQDLTTQIANVTLSAIGQALAEITGSSFSFKLSVEASSKRIDEEEEEEKEEKDISNQSNLQGQNENDNQTVEVDALAKFQSDFQVVMEEAFMQMENESYEIDDVFESVTATLGNPLGKFLLAYVDRDDVELQDVSAQLSQAIQIALTDTLSRIPRFQNDLNITTIISNIQNYFNDIFLSSDDSSGSEINNLTLQLLDAILQPIIMQIGEIVEEDAAQTESFKESASASLFASTIPPATSDQLTTEVNKNDSSIREDQLQISMDILSTLPDTEEAINLIRQAAKEGQNIAIAAAILQSITEQSREDLDKVLVRFFVDKSIPSDTLVYVLTLTVFQGGMDAVEVLVHAIKQTKNLNRLVVAFDYAFTTNDANITDAFVKLMSASVKGKTCGLKNVMESMLNGFTDEERKSITVLLEQTGAGPCVKLEQKIRMAEVEEAPSLETFETRSKDETEQKFESYIPVPVDEIIVSVRVEEDDNPTVSAPIIEVNINMDDATPTQQIVVSAPQSIDSPQIEVSQETTTSRFTLQFPKTSIEKEDSEECIDLQPPGGFTCEQQARFGKCTSSWMIDGGFCLATCGLCDHSPTDSLVYPSPESTSMQLPPVLTSTEEDQETLGQRQAVVFVPLPGTQMKIRNSLENNEQEFSCGCDKETLAEIVKEAVAEALAQVQA